MTSQEKKSYKVVNPKLFPLLDDRAWLYQKYIVEQRSASEIATIVGAKSSNSVRLALLRQRIEIRGRREAQTIGREEDSFSINSEVLVGCLLGDASLFIWDKQSSTSCPYFSKKNKHKEHLEYIAKLLFKKDVSNRIKEVLEHLVYKNQKKEYLCYYLTSLTHDELKPWYKSWYPESSGYKKVIPNNIEITPTVLLHWFLDDGCCTRQKRSDLKQDLLKVVLSSESFSPFDQNRLLTLLNKNFNLQGSLISTGENGKDKRIAFLRQEDVARFFEIIGPCPIKCFEYKWKIREFKGPTDE